MSETEMQVKLKNYNINRKRYLETSQLNPSHTTLLAYEFYDTGKEEGWYFSNFAGRSYPGIEEKSEREPFIGEPGDFLFPIPSGAKYRSIVMSFQHWFLNLEPKLRFKEDNNIKEIFCIGFWKKNAHFYDLLKFRELPAYGYDSKFNSDPMSVGGHTLVFRFETFDDALLFKMRWGTDYYQICKSF